MTSAPKHLTIISNDYFCRRTSSFDFRVSMTDQLASAAVDVSSIILPPIELQQEQHAAAQSPPGVASSEPSPVKTPARKRARSTKSSAAQDTTSTTATPSANGDGNESDLTPTEDLDQDQSASKKRKKTQRKPRKPKEPIVYDIPDIPQAEKKMTTFKGRLGYACLNTVLRNKRPAREAIFCSRTLRIDTIKQKGVDYMKELGKQNMRVRQCGKDASSLCDISLFCRIWQRSFNGMKTSESHQIVASIQH